MKQILLVVLVMAIGIWTAPLFGQTASKLDQVKGKNEVEVTAFMQTLTNDELVALVADAVNAAVAAPLDAAAASLRDLVLSSASKVISAKSEADRNAIFAAIKAAAPSVAMTANQDGSFSLTTSLPSVGEQGGGLPQPEGKKQNDVNQIKDTQLDSQPAAR